MSSEPVRSPSTEMNPRGSPRRAGRDLHLDAGAEAAQDPEKRGARRVQPDVLDLDSRPWQGGGSDQPEGRRREVARHLETLPLKPLSTGHRYAVAVDVDASAEGGERSFGVVAGRRRLEHARRPVRVQTGQQHGALDLGGGGFRLVRNGVQPRSLDGQRRVAVGGLNAGAHALEGRHDATHRAPRQRGVSDKRGRERVSGQHPRQQAHRRTGIAGVERRGRRTELSETSSQ